MHRRARLSAAAVAAVAAALVTALPACSPSPSVTPAPRAGDPACRTALAAAPSTVLGQGRADIRGAGALAWGDPPIVLRCGFPGLAPTSAACLQVNGADWVVADPAADPVVFAAFGRDPTVQLSVPASYGRTSAPGALTGLAAVAGALPSNGHTCQ